MNISVCACDTDVAFLGKLAEDTIRPWPLFASTVTVILNSTNYDRPHALRLPLLYKHPSLPESVHSYPHIMKLVPLSLLLCIPLRALTASVSSGSSPSSPSLPSALSPSPASPQTDMDTVLQRRLGFITASITMVSRIASWHVLILCFSSYSSDALVP
jgi:hypothetical protein